MADKNISFKLKDALIKKFEELQKISDTIEKNTSKLDELKKQIKKLEEGINYLKVGRAKIGAEIELLRTENVQDKQKKNKGKGVVYYQGVPYAKDHDIDNIL